jgi:hypothetical protein
MAWHSGFTGEDCLNQPKDSDLKKRIEEIVELLMYPNPKEKVCKHCVRENAKTILSLFSEYGINPDWEKEFDREFDLDYPMNSHIVNDKVKQFFRNQLRHEQRGKNKI